MTIPNEIHSVTDDACGRTQAILPRARKATRQSLAQPRVTLISLLCILSVHFCSVGEVRPQPKIPRVVLFFPGAASYLAPLKEAFLSGLKDVGRTVGTDLVIDYRGGEGQVDRYPEIAS